MGPPPDPEHMASMLENPNFASTLNEALSNPSVIDQMIRSNPMFQGAMGDQARQMLQDPNFRRMMTDPETLRQMSQMRRQMPGMFGGMGGAGGGDQAFPAPGVTDTMPGQEGGAADRTATPNQTNTTPQQPMNPFAMFGNPAAGAPGAGAGGGGAGANPFAALFGPGGMGAGMGLPAASPPPAAGTESAPHPTQDQQQANPLAAAAQQMMQTPQLMRQMMASMGQPGGMPGSQPPDPLNPSAAAGGGAGGGGGFNPFAALQAMGMGGATASPQPQDDRAPEDRYAEQLRQLNEMGFYEFERNVEALRRTGGSVQGAVEYLLTH